MHFECTCLILISLLVTTFSGDHEKSKYFDPEEADPEDARSPPKTEGGARVGRRGYVFRDTRPSQRGFKVEWDPNGYIFHCLSMGRIGNQMEHLLGSLAFAKEVNRTLVLPPIRTYRNVRFTELFQFEPILEYHRVVLAEDFMDILAPTHWPPEKRIGYCIRIPSSDFKCTLKEGYPFKPFWDDLSVDFVRYDWLDYSYQQTDRFKARYSGSVYPVIAMRGPPASFPMNPDHWPLQRYLHFSDRIVDEAYTYMEDNFKDEPFLGIHLRNGADWENACKIAKTNQMKNFMASPQCLHGTTNAVTHHMCLPHKYEILRLTKKIIEETKVNVLFIATDHDAMLPEFTEHLEGLQVRVYHLDPHLPQLDQAILIEANHFIGNCVSSFTSFVTRSRLVRQKTTLFWGLS